MPRRSRMYLPNQPYHITQRGNNRQPCFFEPDDYQYYLELWKNMSNRYGVLVHAYCLMTNHIHILASPEHETAISDTMRVVGSRYAQFINNKYQRTGSLWEGRHKSSMVQTEQYLLICYRYIELNPVRANMVDLPEDYPWSSYVSNAHGSENWITPHEIYCALGQNSEMRCYYYKKLFGKNLTNSEITQMREAIHFCQPFGSLGFKAEILSRYGLKTGYAKRGRPKNSEIV